MPSANVTDGRQTVTTAGTAVRLAAQGSLATSTDSVLVQAFSANTGKIAVGGSTVLAATASQRGAILAAGQSVSLDVDDPGLLFVDATVNGEGVTWLAIS